MSLSSNIVDETLHSTHACTLTVLMSLSNYNVDCTLPSTMLMETGDVLVITTLVLHHLVPMH
jgi:hypothetical protein